MHQYPTLVRKGVLKVAGMLPGGAFNAANQARYHPLQADCLRSKADWRRLEANPRRLQSISRVPDAA